jgi:hypothetical protein
MRCRLLTALGVLVFCLQATADTPTTVPVQTGEIDLTFTQRSPLSTPKEIARRLNAKEHDLAPDYDLSKFPFKVYVPKNYDPAVPHGVIVYLGYKDSVSVATLWEPALDQNHLIFITPVAHSGHAYDPVIPMWQTLGLAFDALDNLKRTYNVDAKRCYLMAFDNSLQMTLGCADVFTGFIVCMDNNFWAKLTMPNGSYYNATFTLPGGPIFGMAKQRGIVLAFEDIENAGSESSLIARTMKQLGFNVLPLRATAGEDLHYPNLKIEWFEQTALPFLDKAAVNAKVRPASVAQEATTHPTTERAAAPASDEPEPQHLLKVAKLYIDNGQTNFARPKLETIIRKYPYDPAAVTAKQLLDQLPPE